MEIVKFDDCNVAIAEKQKEYQTLHALRIGNQQDTIITCWGLSFWERVRVLFLGRIWMSESNFYKDITPRLLSTNRNDLYTKE